MGKPTKILRNSLKGIRAEEEAPLYGHSIPIHDLNTEAARLTESIQVEIEWYSDEVIARVAELDVWVSETTESEALLSIKKALFDLWEELKEEDDRNLGRLPRMWKRILAQKVAEHVPA